MLDMLEINTKLTQHHTKLALMITINKTTINNQEVLILSEMMVMDIAITFPNTHQWTKMQHQTTLAWTNNHYHQQTMIIQEATKTHTLTSQKDSTDNIKMGN